MSDLTAPRVNVVMADGTEWTVTTGNPDLVAWDLTASRHKWPPVKDAPFLWLTFVTWHASRRRGLLPDAAMTFESFRDSAESLDAPDTPADGLDGPGLVAADPTRPGPGPG